MKRRRIRDLWFKPHKATMRRRRVLLCLAYDDLQLILTTKEIGVPTVKSKKIDIEGADGVPLQRHGCRTCPLCSVQARQYMVRRGG